MGKEGLDIVLPHTMTGASIALTVATVRLRFLLYTERNSFTDEKLA